jgi:hypothetical protein
MAYRSHQRAAPKRNRQETMTSISPPNRPSNGAASSRTFADLPEGLAQKTQGFVRPGRRLIDGESGRGREMGHNALENHLETKSVVTRLA